MRVRVALPPEVKEIGADGETDTSVNGGSTETPSIVCVRNHAVFVRANVYVNCPPATIVIGQAEQALCGEGPK